MLVSFITLILVLALFASGLPTSPIARERPGIDVLKRVGPSGSVNSPYGGESYNNWNQNGLSSSTIYISYNPVQQTSTTGTSTIGLDLYLETLDGSELGFDGTIVNGFIAPYPSASPITGFFLLPAEACGTYRLVFIEHQIYETTQLIKFRAAAPTIEIDCLPFTG